MDEPDPTLADEPEENPVLEGVATSTKKGKNRFVIRLYLRIHGRVIKPVDRKREAEFTISVVCEYPTYEEELQTKKENTTFDEFHGIHAVDHDKIAEWRLRRSIVKWDFHEKMPGVTGRLHRKEGFLADDSLQLILALPPLVRKQLTNKLWEALGPA